ncbi:phosphatase [Pleurocapsa sp. CCALA 161]|uniref:HAD-IA family hydrolase n=1 Tax=Pleurocapsa sp. CCALA 161 TaxID=2107688 RepID=UPI000D05036B|nr:HAD-IA family hydrolase [Pleurocapsa sp. CCALA 161]PSB07491.1 phosphatase [Pleurocapsa sp. CCALA 161]
MSNQLQCLIFDVDGTLANTERDGHRVAFNRGFQTAGLDWHWSVDFYGELLTVSGGKERLKYFLRHYLPEFKPDGELNDFVAHLHQLKTKHYLELLKSGAIALRPGTKRLIESAKAAGITLAIATTTSLPNVIALLEKYLDLDWFAVIAAGDIVPAKKPAPDIYHYVIKRLELDAGSVVVVEDSDNGLASAIAAGLTTVVTVNNYTEQQDFSQAALVLSDLGEPEQPCRVIQGNFAGNYLDLAALRSILIH